MTATEHSVPVFRDRKIHAWPGCPSGECARCAALASAPKPESATDPHYAAPIAATTARGLVFDALRGPGARAQLEDGVAMTAIVFDVGCPGALVGERRPR